MGFRDFNFDFRECSGDLFRKNGHYGIFCVEMARIDQVDAHSFGIPKLIVAGISGDEGIAAGRRSLLQK